MRALVILILGLLLGASTVYPIPLLFHYGELYERQIESSAPIMAVVRFFGPALILIVYILLTEIGGFLLLCWALRRYVFPLVWIHRPRDYAWVLLVSVLSSPLYLYTLRPKVAAPDDEIAGVLLGFGAFQLFFEVLALYFAAVIFDLNWTETPSLPPASRTPGMVSTGEPTADVPAERNTPPLCSEAPTA